MSIDLALLSIDDVARLREALTAADYTSTGGTKVTPTHVALPTPPLFSCWMRIDT